MNRNNSLRLEGALQSFLDGRVGADELRRILEEEFSGGSPDLEPEIWREFQLLDMDLSLHKPHLEGRFRGWQGLVSKVLYEAWNEPAPSMERIRKRASRILTRLRCASPASPE